MTGLGHTHRAHAFVALHLLHIGFLIHLHHALFSGEHALLHFCEANRLACFVLDSAYFVGEVVFIIFKSVMSTIIFDFVIRSLDC